MASESGSTHTTLGDAVGDRSVAHALFTEPYRFDFYQAVRMLEWHAREVANADAGSSDRCGQPVGGDCAPDQEAVRFRSVSSLSFAPASIREVRPGAPPAPPEMFTAFLGLTGPSGVLPYHYTSLVIERLREKDPAINDFFDLFNHRTVSLFYRAWEKFRFTVAWERCRSQRHRDGHAPSTHATDDLFTSCLFSLIGLGTPSLRGRSDVADEVLLFYSGHFSHAPRSASALEAIVGEYLGVNATIEQFRGQWLALNVADRTRLPGLGLGELHNNQLGISTVVGEKVWDVQSKFRVRLGPLTYRDYCRFVPGGSAAGQCFQMIRAYVGTEFDFEIQLILLGSEVPECRLGPGAGPRPLLGQNVWMRSRPFEKNFEDAVFNAPE